MVKDFQCILSQIIMMAYYFAMKKNTPKTVRKFWDENCTTQRETFNENAKNKTFRCGLRIINKAVPAYTSG